MALGHKRPFLSPTPSHLQGFHRPRGTRSGLSLPLLIPPDVKRCCSGEQLEKSPILFALPHLPRSPGLQVPCGTKELPGSVRPFTLVEKWPPFCQVPALAAPSAGACSHQRHLSARTSNSSGRPKFTQMQVTP